MTESNYSKRELDHYFKDIKETLNRQNETLARIESQTTKTNGRVSALEYWRNILVWGFSIGMTIILFTINYFKK